MDYTEFKSKLNDTKRTSDPICCRYIYRPLSFPVGWIFYKSGMKANSISLLSIFLAIMSSLIMIFGSPKFIVLASSLMLLVALLDCIDGNVARARGETGPAGEWMDALSGYTVYAILPLSLGIHLYLHNPHTSSIGLWIIVGSITSITNLFLRLIYQKYISSKLDESTQNQFKGSGSLFSRISSEMGLVGWMMPFLLVAASLNMLHIYITIYCFFFVFSAVIITIVLVRKVF